MSPPLRLPRLGGDWYDAMALSGAATCVVVGDVTGHNVEAAPMTGQTRNMLRGARFRPGRTAGLVMSRLDRADDVRRPADRHPGARRIEHSEGGEYTFSWSNAGHLRRCWSARTAARPTWHPRHGTRWASTRPSPGSPMNTLPFGSTLLLFTDGLVERRDQDIDTGLDDLAEQAARLATAPLEELCDTLISPKPAGVRRRCRPARPAHSLGQPGTLRGKRLACCGQVGSRVRRA